MHPRSGKIMGEPYRQKGKKKTTIRKKGNVTSLSTYLSDCKRSFLRSEDFL